MTQQLRHLTHDQLDAILVLAKAAQAARDAWETRADRPGLQTSIGRVMTLVEMGADVDAFQRFGDPKDDALAAVLALLPLPALAEVAGLMWLGRGDVDTIDDGAEMFHTDHGIDEAVAYIVGKGPLVEYLCAGVVKLSGRAAA